MQNGAVIRGVLAAALLAAGCAAAAPVRLAVGAINRDGQITLTPGFSPDGQTAYFAQSACAEIGNCPQRMMVARKLKGQWTPAVQMMLPGDGPTANGTPARVDYPSVSPDGRQLLFSWSVARADKAMLLANEDFDLYRLDLTHAGTVPEPLDMADINRPRAGAIAKIEFVHNETAPVLTAAGDLYFWTERPDGVGDRDVFVAPGDGRGGFARARPLPAPVNGPGSDTSGWVSPNGTTMLLALTGRGGQRRHRPIRDAPASRWLESTSKSGAGGQLGCRGVRRGDHTRWTRPGIFEHARFCRYTQRVDPGLDRVGKRGAGATALRFLIIA